MENHLQLDDVLDLKAAAGLHTSLACKSYWTRASHGDRTANPSRSPTLQTPSLTHSICLASNLATLWRRC